MGGAVGEGTLQACPRVQAVDQSGREPVTRSDAVQYVQAGHLGARDEPRLGRPGRRGPVVDTGRGHAPQRRRQHPRLGHPVRHFQQCLRHLVGTEAYRSGMFARQAQGTHHDVGVACQPEVDLACLLRPAPAGPETRAVVGVVGDGHAVPAGGGHRLLGDPGRGVRQPREDAAGVEPAGARGEDGVPVDVARPQLGHRCVGAVTDPEGSPDAEAAFHEVEAVASGAPDAVGHNPADERGVDSTLQDEVLGEAAHLVVHESRDDGRPQTEAAAQSPDDVVLATTLPDLEGTGGADPALARVEAQHHLAEGDHVRSRPGHAALLSTASAVSLRISA